MRSIVARLDEKEKFFEIIRKFSKIFKNLSRKLPKMHNLSIFFKCFNKACVNSSRIWTKNANFWEILRKNCNVLMKIPLKNWILYFYLYNFNFFANLLLKIEPSEITPFFYNILFGFGVGGKFPTSPWLRPWDKLLIIYLVWLCMKWYLNLQCLDLCKFSILCKKLKRYTHHLQCFVWYK